jgi:hypothetical protein
MRKAIPILMLLFTLSSWSNGIFINGQVNQQSLTATSEDNFAEMFSYINRKDQKSVLAMVRRGEVILLDKGTRFYLIDGGFIKNKIKITSGTYEGIVVYIPREFCTLK